MFEDIVELKKSLTVDDITLLLMDLGAEHIHHNEKKRELITNTICHNLTGGSHKLYYKIDNYSFRCYTECSCSFDIYELVKKVYKLRDSEINFRETIEFVKFKTQKSNNIFAEGFLIPNQPKKNEELAYLKRFIRKSPVELLEPQTHDDRILDVFSKRHHESFYNDGISHEVLEAFEIGFYEKENAIIIPHRYYKDGKIIGIKMRNLDEWKIENGYKYIPVKVQGTLYNHSSYANLYGLWQNQEAIRRLKKVAIFESEKSVMQMATMFGMDNNYSIALSGKNISQSQVEILLAMDVEEVIICLDKEYQNVRDNQAFTHAKKIVEIGRRFSKRVRTFTIWDKDGLLDYKDSPSDNGRLIFLKLLEKKEEVWSKSF